MDQAFGILYTLYKKHRTMRKWWKTPSRTSPKSSARGCLCKDTNTYSRKCCDGSLWSQGIGKIYGSD